MFQTAFGLKRMVARAFQKVGAELDDVEGQVFDLE